MRFDIHTHTNLVDGVHSSREMVERAKSIGLDGIAITDHDEIRGSIEAQKYSTKDFIVIPGVEISAREGHILCIGSVDIPERYIGAFLRKDYPPADEVVDVIHDIGGVAIAAHPYDRFRSALGDLVYRLEFDAIEVVNGHTLANTKNPVKVAQELGLTMVGGSDAHNAREVGNVCIETDNDPLDAIRKGKVRIVCNSKIKILSDFLKSGIVKSYFKF